MAALRLLQSSISRGAIPSLRSAYPSARLLATQAPPPPPPPSQPPNVPSLDFSPPEPEPEPQRTGAKSAKDSLSSIERRRRIYARTTIGLALFGLGAGWVYMGREWEPDERKPKTEEASSNAFSARVNRANTRIMDLFDYFNKPAWSELLPPPLPQQYQKKYTLLLSIDDLLVTSTWDRVNGWRTAKRPGADYFVKYLSQFYEIVIFTTQPHYTALPIIDNFDPYQYYISYQLFREATRSVSGKIVKDLSYLNRDLSKVIAIDTSAERYMNQPENAIIVPKWNGKPGDDGLVRLIPFLESVGIHAPQDVRPILKAYEGKDIALEYAKQEAAHKKRLTEEWEREHKHKKGVSSGGLTLSSLFSTSTDRPKADEPPMTYLEQKRKLAQQIYREEMEYWAKNEQVLKKAKEEQQQLQMQEMPGTLSGVFSQFLKGPPGPPGQQPSQDEGKSRA